MPECTPVELLREGIDSSLVEDSSTTPRCLQLAIIEAKAGNKEAARRHLHVVLANSPGNSHAWHWLSTVLDSPFDAVDCLRQVVALDPNNLKAREDLERLNAQLAFQKKYCPLCGASADPPQADCWECGARLTLDNPKWFLRPGRVNLAQMKAAIAHYGDLLTASPDFPTRYALGLAYLNLGLWKEGVRAMRAAVALRPYCRDFWQQVEELRISVEGFERQSHAIDQRESPCILVVDDSPTVRKLVTMTLEREGYRVVEAADGFEAVNLLNQVVPDLICLDIVLPGVDGYSLCKIIRTKPETSSVPIIMLSAKEGFFDRIRGKAAGADGYLIKPFAVTRLLEEISRFTTIGSPRVSR